MHTAVASNSNLHSPLRTPTSRRADAVHSDASTFSRANVEGGFSLFANGSIGIDAEAGLVIRVVAGCLWVPDADEHCSVGVGAGEQFVVKRGGRLTVFAGRGTQVELEWPSRERPLGLH